MSVDDPGRDDPGRDDPGRDDPGRDDPGRDDPTAGDPVVRVLVVDDHPMWRDAVERDLVAAGLHVVGTSGDGAKAVRVAAAVAPDVVVMDLHLPELSGVRATEQIVGARPQTRVLVLSASGEQDDVLAAVKAGATGYLVKSACAEELVEAVRRTAAGEATFTPGLAGLLLGEYRRLAGGGADRDDRPRLSERETEVLRQVAKGLTARQVAARLVISHRTVQNHVANAMAKLSLHNKAMLVRYAIESGLDEPDER